MSAQIYTLSNLPSSISISGATGAVGSTTIGGQLQTLSLSNLNSSAGFNLFSNTQNVKKYEVIETTEDLLALSCTWYRIRNSKDTLRPMITSLVSEDLFRQVTPEDRVHADEVREYYSKKFMVMALKEERLTQFRQDLKEYINGDPKKFTEKTIPMVYRLPEFHAHDIEFDVIKREFDKEIPQFNQQSRRTSDKPVRLTPVKSFKKNSKLRGKFVEYWLKDPKNRAYRFGLNASNPLLGLWDNQFNSGDMHLTINYQVARRDDLQFFNIGSVLPD